MTETRGNVPDTRSQAGFAQSIHHVWSQEFLEAGKRRLADDTAPSAKVDTQHMAPVNVSQLNRRERRIIRVRTPVFPPDRRSQPPRPRQTGRGRTGGDIPGLA
jgi:hypothetical protein